MSDCNDCEDRDLQGDRVPFHWLTWLEKIKSLFYYKFPWKLQGVFFAAQLSSEHLKNQHASFCSLESSHWKKKKMCSHFPDAYIWDDMKVVNKHEYGNAQLQFYDCIRARDVCRAESKNCLYIRGSRRGYLPLPKPEWDKKKASRTLK